MAFFVFIGIFFVLTLEGNYHKQKSYLLFSLSNVMDGSLNTARESAGSLQAHLSIISDCLSQISQALSLTWEQVREYASKVMSSFGGSASDNSFLQVDRIIIMIKKMVHHLRDMLNDISIQGTHTQHYALVGELQEHIALIERSQHSNFFLQRTFGWALQEPVEMMKAIIAQYHIKK